MTTRDEKLEALALKMEALVPTNKFASNREDNHIQADDILKETIDALKTRGNRSVVARILLAYNALDKWFG